MVRHLRPDQGKIDAGYTAHPSFVQDDELKDIQGPLSISAAETDEIFPNGETATLIKDLYIFADFF